MLTNIVAMKTEGNMKDKKLYDKGPKNIIYNEEFRTILEHEDSCFSNPPQIVIC